MAAAKTLTAIQSLLAGVAPPELGPGPRAGVPGLAELNARLDAGLAPLDLRPPRRDLIRATVLLWHDHLEASHRISQSLTTPDGSYVHGMMHRREPDYANSKYWFRLAGPHPLYPELAARVGALLRARNDPFLSSQLLARGQWDPLAFVDACDAASARPADDPRVQTLRAVQALEFEVLLDYCCRVNAV